MIRALPAEIDVDLIVPVPLHPASLRAREFNQSLLLADQLGRHLKRPVSTTDLVRIHRHRSSNDADAAGAVAKSSASLCSPELGGSRRPTRAPHRRCLYHRHDA